MSAIKKFAGQTAIYGITTIFSRILYFFLTPVYTNVYKPAVYGVFTVLYSYASIINPILAFGMETTFFRFLNKQDVDKKKVYNNAFLIVAGLALIFLAFAWLFVDDIALWLKKDNQTLASDYATYVKLFIYLLVADAICVIPFAKLRADGRPIKYGLIKIVNILSCIGLNLFFIYVVPYIINNHYAGAALFESWYRPGWVGYVFISNLAASVITLAFLIPEIAGLQVKFDRSLFYQMFHYSWPVLIANLSFIINENLDKLLLDNLLPAGISSHDTGIYGACAKIAVFLNIFIQAFRLGAEPFFFSHAKNKNSGETYARIMNYFVITVCLIFIAITANINILKHFVGPSYWEGLKVVPVLLFGYVSLGIYMNLSIWYKLSDQTKYGLYISGVGAIVTIVFNLLFIPKFSYMAAAWVSLSAYASMMVLSYILGQKNYPIPYNLQKNLAYIVASIVVVYLCFVTFNRSLVLGNLLLVLSSAGALYIERKELKAILLKK
ncbi:oligosaccharide flippase family protein [Pedobacter sp. HMF7647]|uniref:Oligosaccharide flippase family protein n=1 Tax=Hufsiella arboris TaxID=2695275 RepID=A0A7K1YCC1_9SPHI|nr:oligosaccharide flippase family protein [Hufsiella arboris]MXV51739.1 oligosaccharide flippase family protein [Hufsiella arboris]